MNLIVAGGGTGGHVLAGVAVAEAWKAQGGETIFVGSQGGLEERLVPKAGFPLILLRMGGLNRVGRLNQLITLLKLPLALMKSTWILFHYRPKAVLGVGGFASGPLVLMAGLLSPLLGCRVGILEQNSVPGLTNRLLGRFSHLVFGAFEGLEKRFSKPVYTVGNPVRPNLVQLGGAPRRPFGIFVFGGSRGAVGMNTVVMEALAGLLKDGLEIKVLHQAGTLDLERVTTFYKERGLQVDVRTFVDDMAIEYERASLVVCRAGSSSLAELSTVGRASILVPLPTATDNHQEHNARFLLDRSAAHMVLQRDPEAAQTMAQKIRHLYENPQELDSMESEVVKYVPKDSAQKIVRVLREGQL